MIDPGEYNNVIKVGSTWTLQFQIQTDGSGAWLPEPLTNYSARCQLRPNPFSSEFILTATCTVNAVLGTVQCSLSPTLTSTIPQWCQQLDYDVELYTLGDGDVFCPIQGFMTVEPNTTVPVVP